MDSRSRFADLTGAYTNTHSVGVVRDALVAAEREMGKQHTYWCMPVVLETYDGT